MNWEAIGAVAELLGAIGVIGALIYLASQIRDTRCALRASTYQQANDSMHDATPAGLSREFSELVSEIVAGTPERGAS